MTTHRRIPLKITPRLFISYFNKAKEKEVIEQREEREKFDH